jgi:CrcB protein
LACAGATGRTAAARAIVVVGQAAPLAVLRGGAMNERAEGVAQGESMAVPPRPAADIWAAVPDARTRTWSWDVTAAIAVGGAVGAVARYAVSTAWPHAAGELAWSILAVNTVGCLLIGIIMVLLTETLGRPHRLARPFLGVGILGGFTTFSTYAVDAERTFAAGRALPALAYTFGTLAAALVAVQVGIVLTREVTRART